jgi:uncharacterized protein
VKALFVSPLGLLIGLSLGALGGGGSILAVPVLVYAAGQPVRAATTTSLLVVGVAAVASVVGHWRAGRVMAGPGTVVGLAGVGGSFAGSALNRGLDPDVLLLAFSALVLVAAWRMVTGCPSCTRAGERQALALATPGERSVGGLRLDGPTVAKVLAVGTVVGFFTGLFGVGGGFIIVPALTLVMGFTMPVAIGTSILVVAINSALALVARLGDQGVDWAVAGPFTVAAVAGALAGSRVADRLPARLLVRAFATLLVLVAAYTAARALADLL